MAPERNPLTPEAVSLAESRVGVIHPVISVIDNNLPTILKLTEGYNLITDNQEQQRYIAEHYGFFADSIIEALPFTLEPTDLISIWSRAIEVFSGYHRYALVGMISSAYAIQGLENPEWKKLPRHLLEIGELPNEILHDSFGLLHVRKKVKEITESLDELDFYVYGMKGSTLEYAVQLAKREKEGDTTARVKLDRLTTHEKKSTTPTLREIHENFGNGLFWWFGIQDALKELGVEIT
ncbi:MAG: hypothetical protein WEC80_02570 [Patescibacteria group bacterium]